MERSSESLIEELEASRSALLERYGHAMLAVSLYVGFQDHAVPIASDDPTRLAELAALLVRGGSPIAIFGLVASAVPGEVVLHRKVLREYEGAPWVSCWMDDVTGTLLNAAGGAIVSIDCREWTRG